MLSYVPYVALLVVVMLIYVPRAVVAGAMKQQAGGYNNHDPRAQQAQLEGRGRRALGAHQNAIEFLPIFGVSVLAALQRGVDQRIVAAACIVVVVTRTLYLLLYLADKASLRSSCWGLALLGCIGLLGAAIVGA